MRVVKCAPHEFSANLIFDDYALRPYFGMNQAVKRGEGSVEARFALNGEDWTARLSYKDSGIIHPGETNPQGTEFLIESVPEYELVVQAADDPAEQKSFHVNISPRWQGMKVENSNGERSELSIPSDIHEGINLTVSGSNIPFADYLPLLREAFGAVGIRRQYFQNPHRHSNVRDAEMYVRLHRERSGPVHAREGTIAKLGHLLENDRAGYRKLVQNDEDEHGRNLPGYYHTVTLGPNRVSTAFAQHHLPREIKHYYSREAAGMDEDDPLAHPKLGASYQANRWDEKLDVEADALDRLERELSETVLSVLSEDGIQVHTGPADPFVSDAYFDADEHDRDDPLTDLDLTEIESHQEHVVINHLADGFSPVEWESLETLVTDGGRVSPTDIAETNDRHVGSVRRALNRIPEMVEHAYGEVSLRSDYIAELVAEAVNDAKESIRRAVDTGAKARLAAERGEDHETSTLMAFAAKHGIDVNGSREARLHLRMNREGARRRIKEMARLWEQAGRDMIRLREAQIEFNDGSVSPLFTYLR
jgi:hypothetical protein